MPKRRDPTLMEKLQRQDTIKSQLKTKPNLSPQQGVKKGLKPKGPDGMGRRGHPY